MYIVSYASWLSSFYMWNSSTGVMADGILSLLLPHEILYPLELCRRWSELYQYSRRTSSLSRLSLTSLGSEIHTTVYKLYRLTPPQLLYLVSHASLTSSFYFWNLIYKRHGWWDFLSITAICCSRWAKKKKRSSYSPLRGLSMAVCSINYYYGSAIYVTWFRSCFEFGVWSRS